MTNNKPRLTQKVAKELIAMLGGKLIRNTEWDEYIVRTGPEETYHCNDLSDAVGTALVFFGSHPEAENVKTILAGYSLGE